MSYFNKTMYWFPVQTSLHVYITQNLCENLIKSHIVKIVNFMVIKTYIKDLN